MNTTLSTRLLLLATLSAVELFLSVRLYTTPPAFNDPALTWAQPLLARKTEFGALLFGIATWIALAQSRLAKHWSDFIEAARRHRPGLPLLAQSAACLACYSLAWPLYARPAEVGTWGWPLLLSLGLCVAVSGFLGLWLFAPLRYWRDLASAERPALVIACTAAVGGAALIEAVRAAWRAIPLLAGFTLQSSAALLRHLYPDVHADPASRLLAIGSFQVMISDICSGYLGVSLTLGFVAAYCYLFRAEIRPWLMIVIAPLAVLLSLSLNVLRIVGIMILGVEFSPEVAVNGFHTNAGSIAMVLCCAVLVGIIHWTVVARPRSGAEAVQRLGWSLDYESALLLPLMTLLAATLLTGAISGKFVWLYPLRVVAVGAVLGYCWPQLKLLVSRPAGASIAIGAAVFPIWLVLISPEPEADELFRTSLAGASSGLSLAWIACRVLGAVITVPIAEELAFRGYLLSLLSRRPLRLEVAVPFDWLGFVGSSLLFGLLHGHVLAGTVAGMAYAWARYRRGRLIDAVVAHATTNLLLAVYVLASGHWFYW